MSRLIALIFFLSCTSFSFSQKKNSSISSLKLIGTYEIPYNEQFKNTIIGGLSGIDYDATANLYYLISDDRSAKNDARFYTARIHISARGIDSVQMMDVKTLLQANGKPYPHSKSNPGLTPDPESIRVNPKTHELVWSSEGERIITANGTVLQNPSIQIAGFDGKHKSSFVMPPILSMQPIPNGPRQNGTIEGLSFSEDYSTLYACLEEPLYQDGPRADVTDTKSYVRILSFDVAQKNNVKQYPYLLEKVAYPATPSDAFKVNGVSEILWIAKNELLVVERSFSTGRLACSVKIFLADLSLAEHIQTNGSLLKNPPKKSATKKLLLDMDMLGLFIDNIEGVTFGPTLPNGHSTLVFIADNNFQPFEKNQFLLVEVIP